MNREAFDSKVCAYQTEQRKFERVGDQLPTLASRQREQDQHVVVTEVVEHMM